MATPGGGGGGGATGDAEVAASPSLDGIIGSVEGALETLRKVSALLFLHFSLHLLLAFLPLSPSYFSGVQIAELSQNVEAGSECAVGTEVGALVEQL